MEIFEIETGLYQSTKIDEFSAVLPMEVVIDLEGGFDNFSIFHPVYLYWHIFDVPFMPNTDQLWNVARFGFNEWKAGKKVLVHCTQGKNRSGLVNGCILWLNGMNGEEAVKLIQTKRPGALFNPVFKNYLVNLGTRFRRGEEWITGTN